MLLRLRSRRVGLLVCASAHFQRTVAIRRVASASTGSVPVRSGHVVSVRRVHTSPSVGKVIPYLLTDIGEGNAEAEVLEWFVSVGDTVNMFDPIVNVQSDKVRRCVRCTVCAAAMLG